MDPDFPKVDAQGRSLNAQTETPAQKRGPALLLSALNIRLSRLLEEREIRPPVRHNARSYALLLVQQTWRKELFLGYYPRR